MNTQHTYLIFGKLRLVGYSLKVVLISYYLIIICNAFIMCYNCNNVSFR